MYWNFYFLSVILIMVNNKYSWGALGIGLALTLMILWGGKYRVDISILLLVQCF